MEVQSAERKSATVVVAQTCIPRVIRGNGNGDGDGSRNSVFQGTANVTRYATLNVTEFHKKKSEKKTNVYGEYNELVRSKTAKKKTTSQNNWGLGHGFLCCKLTTSVIFSEPLL